MAFGIKSAPAFWIGSLAVALLGYQLGWVPTVGMRTPGTDIGQTGLAVFATADFLHHLALPLLLLTLHFSVEPMLTMRSAMIGVLHEDYMGVFQAMGLRRWLRLRRGVRNAMLPVVTLAPAAVDNIVGGAVVIETIFSWPGMGRAVVNAVYAFDYPMLQGIFLLTAVIVVVGNALTDIGYAYLDPRVGLR